MFGAEIDAGQEEAWRLRVRMIHSMAMCRSLPGGHLQGLAYWAEHDRLGTLSAAELEAEWAMHLLAQPEDAT